MTEECRGEVRTILWIWAMLDVGKRSRKGRKL